MSNVDFRSFEATEYDLKKEIQRLYSEINDKNIEIKKLNTELFNITNSKSWKITKPIRKFKKIIYKKSIKNNVENIYDNAKYYKKLSPYNSNYQENINFSKYKTDIKPLAFYLPQYHTFKENDEWWGKGFMEWTNTKKSLPRFEGHYQPRTPNKDIGYYTLDNIENIKKQIKLAKQHGIFGFCYYYYWFSGKRLMEKPLDLFIESDIDFPFCICWANENWTRAWDGRTKDILIKQDYSTDDYEKFILDIKKYINDKRYIKIDDKPLIMIYNPDEIPDFKSLVSNWRKYANKHGIGELYIACKCDLYNTEHEYTDFVDAQFDFPPHGVGHKETKVYGLDSEKIFDYTQIVDDIEHLYKEHIPLKPFYYCCTMGWDNSARRTQGYTIYYNYSLESYYKWLRIIIDETRRRNRPENRYIFINAWNEWAEGTYLEPDEKYGYANINTLSKAIYDLPLDKEK